MPEVTRIGHHCTLHLVMDTPRSCSSCWNTEQTSMQETGTPTLRSTTLHIINITISCNCCWSMERWEEEERDKYITTLLNRNFPFCLYVINLVYGSNPTNRTFFKETWKQIRKTRNEMSHFAQDCVWVNIQALHVQLPWHRHPGKGGKEIWNEQTRRGEGVDSSRRVVLPGAIESGTIPL